MNMPLWLACAALAVAVVTGIFVFVLHRRSGGHVKAMQEALRLLTDDAPPVPIDEPWRHDVLSADPPPPRTRKG